MKKTGGLDVYNDTIFCAIYEGSKYGSVEEFYVITNSIL